MNDHIPVIVRMGVECARCGHSEDDTYEFDLPFAKAQAMEAYEPARCPKCGAAIQMHLKRTVSAFVRWRTDATRANAR
jgi:DNA-directed RNA polymerase subunit RPC12/RpoP